MRTPFRPSRRRFLTGASALLAGLVLTPGAILARSARRVPRAAWRLSDALIARLPGRLAKTGVPGMTVALGPRPEGPAVHAFGALRSGGEARVGPDAVFPAGSLSKPVLATVALELAARGTFDLDRPLVEFLDSDLPGGPGSGRATARHALAHATGLPNWRFTADTPLDVEFEPGSAWSYSGEGYVLVQRALEATTGRGLEGLARELVFDPIGMASTTYLWRPGLEGRVAVPHVPADHRFEGYAALGAWKSRALLAWAEGEGRDAADLRLDEAAAADSEIGALAGSMAGRELPRPPPLPNFLVPNAAGSLLTSAGDYARFLAHWLERRDLRAEAFADPVEAAEGVDWGLGWGLDRATDPASFWHWGEGLGFRALAYADPGAGQGLVVLTNGEAGMELAKEVFQDATGRPLTARDAI